MSGTSGSIASGNDDPNDQNYTPDDALGEEEEENEESSSSVQTNETKKKSSTKHMSERESDVFLRICLNEFDVIRNTETGKGPSSTLALKKKNLEIAEAWQRIQQAFELQTKVCYCILATHNIIGYTQEIIQVMFSIIRKKSLASFYWIGLQFISKKK